MISYCYFSFAQWALFV